MKKLQLIKESFVATLLTLLITFIVSFLPFKFEFTKAIRQEFLGFDIFDLYYSGKHHSNQTRDNNIILVQIADDWESIADQIQLISSYKPAVIGVDAWFDASEDSAGNSKLAGTIFKTDNLILANRLMDGCFNFCA